MILTAQKRSQMAAAWQTILGAGPSSPPAAQLGTVSEDRNAGVRRRLIRYRVEEDAEAEAYLLEPAAPPRPQRISGSTAGGVADGEEAGS